MPLTNDLEELCPCSMPMASPPRKYPPIAFAQPCARYDQRGRGCSLHGHCYEADRVELGHTFNLQKCVDYLSVGAPDPLLKPDKVIRIKLTNHFNCGIIEWKGKLLLSSRLGWAGSISLSELDSEYQPIETWSLLTRHPNALIGNEDPRLFALNSQLHLAFTGYSYGNRTVQLYARIGDTLRNVESIYLPEYEKAQDWEKNWQFFEHEGELYSVYTIAPHVILRHDKAKAVEVCRSDSRLQLNGLILRGGAPPVKVGNEFYHWFHTLRVSHDTYEYGLALYTFEAKPPFTQKRYVGSVIMVADGKMVDQQKSVVFPCGALLRNGKWIISYGHNDNECRIAEFDAVKIERRLVCAK